MNEPRIVWHHGKDFFQGCACLCGCEPCVSLDELREGLFTLGYEMRPVDLDALEDVPLSKAATESVIAELRARMLSQNVPVMELSRHLISAAEKEILDAAKALSCKPVRLIENGFDPDGPESVPAPAGMMTLGGRGEIRKVCEAVIRWRATQEDANG